MELTSHAGHSPLSPGASGHGYNEHEVARIINSDFIALTGAVDSTSNAATQNAVLSEQVRKANASGAKLAVAWHLNAATAAASGAEVWYYAGSADGRAYAERVSAAISGLLGIPNRGAKPSTALYWLNQTNMTAILIEVGFISNAKDIGLIIKHTSDIARVTAVALGAYTPAAVPVTAAPAPKVQDAVVIFHAASDVALNLIVQAWGKGYAGYPLPAGQKYVDALSYIDALNYIPKGATAEAKFPDPDGVWSVGIVHCSLAYALEIKAYCDAHGIACIPPYLAGPHCTGYTTMTAALAAALRKGIDFPAVFGIPA